MTGSAYELMSIITEELSLSFVLSRCIGQPRVRNVYSVTGAAAYCTRCVPCSHRVRKREVKREMYPQQGIHPWDGKSSLAVLLQRSIQEHGNCCTTQQEPNLPRERFLPTYSLQFRRALNGMKHTAQAPVPVCRGYSFPRERISADHGRTQ